MILLQATGADCGRLLTVAIVGTAKAANGKPTRSSTASVVVAICHNNILLTVCILYSEVNETIQKLQ